MPCHRQLAGHLQEAVGRLVRSVNPQITNITVRKTVTGLPNTALRVTQPFDIKGEPCRDRTCDKLIKSQLLYQLS